ncbi:MAG: NYN domain-containing protein [Anaerolineae bacterium]
MNGITEKPDDVAVFFDFENIVYALRNNYNINANFEDLMDKCKEFGRVVVAHAFADWNRHSGSMTTALISNGMDPVYVPTFFMDEGGKQTPRKNAVDMYMAIDAMDVLHNRKSVDTFILLTGDSDFVPLVNAIRREGNRVIAIGVDGTTSSHLAQSVDEYILYSQFSNLQTKSYKKKPKDPFDGLVQAVKKLQQQKKVALLPNVKMMMAELMGGFDEKKHSDSAGRRYQKFKEFVQDAEQRNMVQLVTTGTVNEIYLPDQTPSKERYGNSGSGRDRNDRRSRDRNDRDQRHEQEDVEVEYTESEDNEQSGLTLAVAFNILIEAINKAKDSGKSMRPPSIKGIMRDIYPDFDEKKISSMDREPFTRFGEFTSLAAEQGLITITGKGPRQEISLNESESESKEDKDADNTVDADAAESENTEVEAAPVEAVTLSGDVPEDIAARVLIIETLTTYPNYPASFLQVESYCRQLRNKKKIELSSTRVRNLMTEVTRSLQLLKRVSKPGKSPSQYKLEKNDKKIAEFLGVPIDSIAAVMQGEYSIADSDEGPAAEVETVEKAEAVEEVVAEEVAAVEESTDSSADDQQAEAEAPEQEEVAAEVVEEAEPEVETPAVEALTLTGAFRLLVSAITQNTAEEKSLKLRSIKTTMVSLNDTFDEKNFKNDRDKPFKSFIEFARAAARDGIVELSGKGPKTEIAIVE